MKLERKKMNMTSKKYLGIFAATLGLAGAFSSSSTVFAAATTGFEGCIVGICAGASSVGCTGAESPSGTCDATNASNVASVIASFQGPTDEVAAIKAGTMPSGSKGYLTLPNELLIMVQQLITAGSITAANLGAAGLTIQAPASVGTATLHIVLNPGPTVGGTAYAYEMKLWMCNGLPAACTSASDFYQKAYMAWTVDSLGLTNQGVLGLVWGQTGIPGSAPEGGMNVVWNIGTAATSRTVTATMYDATSTPASIQRFDAVKAGSVLNLTELWGQFSSFNGTTFVANGTFAHSHRDAVTFDTSALTGSYSGEGYNCATQANNIGTCGTTNGSPSCNTAATSDTPTSWQCFTAAATSDDYSYAPVLTGQSCVLTAAYPAVSLTDLAAIVSPQIMAVVGGSYLNGMTTAPANI
jgi:hypothetical protein